MTLDGKLHTIIMVSGDITYQLTIDSNDFHSLMPEIVHSTFSLHIYIDIINFVFTLILTSWSD